ncbi:MAG: hypothetical protein VXZ05_04100 [Pseudomonadota bacterium]|nr:hypothetical protein [Pseudomonadota bacterium]
MESLSTYPLFWLLYLVAGVIAYGCWGRMAFWVKQPGIGYHLYASLGAIIIFTPVAIPGDGMTLLAPGFVAVPFTLIQEGVSALHTFLPWYAAALTLALIAVIVGSVIEAFKPAPSSASEETDSQVAS